LHAKINLIGLSIAPCEQYGNARHLGSIATILPPLKDGFCFKSPPNHSNN
jgi:hypothetical protein